MKKIILILLFISNFLLANNIGKIVSFNGEATILREGKTIQVDKNSVFQKDDTLNTKENTKLQILFLDETIISIGQNSTLKINDYLFEEKNTKAEFTMAKGIFRTITGKIGKIAPENFKLKTKSASIGIRGTQIVVALENNNEKIFCTEGQIEIKNNITNDSVILNNGEFISFKVGSKEKFNTKKTKKSDIEKINKSIAMQDDLPGKNDSSDNNTEDNQQNMLSNKALKTLEGEKAVVDISVDKSSTDSSSTDSSSTDSSSTDSSSTDSSSTDSSSTDSSSTDSSSTDSSSTGELSGLDDVSNFITKTPASFFNRNNSTASYIGNFPSTLSSTNNLVNITGQTVAIPSSSRISMDIDFGATANEISNGKVNISDIGNGTSKILTFDGDLNGKSATFSLSPTGGAEGTGGSGTLYGDSANFMNGNINLKSTDNVEIKSDFSAKKQ